MVTKFSFWGIERLCLGSEIQGSKRSHQEIECGDARQGQQQKKECLTTIQAIDLQEQAAPIIEAQRHGRENLRKNLLWLKVEDISL